MHVTRFLWEGLGKEKTTYCRHTAEDEQLIYDQQVGVSFSEASQVTSYPLLTVCIN